MNKTKKNIEDFLSNVDFSRENEEFKENLNKRLRYKLDTGTLEQNIESPEKQRKRRLSPITAFSIGLIATLLISTLTVFGDDIINYVKTTIKLSDRVFVSQYSNEFDLKSYYRTVNQMLEGRLFDAEGNQIPFYITDEFGNYIENPANKYQEDGSAAYKFTTQEDENRNILKIDLVTEEEYLAIFGKTEAKSLYTLDEAKSAVDWTFKIPAKLPEEYSFDHAIVQTHTYGLNNFSDSSLKLTYGKEAVETDHDDTIYTSDKIVIEINTTRGKHIEHKFHFGSDINMETFDCGGIEVVTVFGQYMWVDSDILYNCYFFGSREEFTAILESME